MFNPSFFGNTNGIPGGTVSFPSGLVVQGQVQGGSVGYNYNVNATQTIAPGISASANANNVLHPVSNPLGEHQVSAGINFHI